MRNKDRVICCAFFLGIGLGFNVNACSVDNWDVKVGIINADADSPPPGWDHGTI